MKEWLDAIITSNTVDIHTAVFRLLFSFFIGALIGLERQFRRQNAGMRTFTLICLGSTVAMLISIWIPQTFLNFHNGDPGRIAAQVLSGIGFIGAGAIIQSRGNIHGLTTAACLWVTAVIGLSIGAGMYIIAIVAAVITLVVLITLDRLERFALVEGVSKNLFIFCNSTNPDMDKIRSILNQHKIFIINLSFEQDFEKERSIISYKVHVKSKATYNGLFEDLRLLGNIYHIKLLS